MSIITMDLWHVQYWVNNWCRVLIMHIRCRACPDFIGRWLKGMNSTGATATHDIGGDARSGHVNQYE